MDAAEALAELTAVSSQIEAAVVVDEVGDVVAAAGAHADALGGAGRTLLSQAAAARDGREPTQLDVATAEGSVFVVRDGGRAIVAATREQPTAGLVFYDLRSCLRSIVSPPGPDGA